MLEQEATDRAAARRVRPAVLEIDRERDAQDVKWGPAEEQPDGLFMWRIKAASLETIARVGMEWDREVLGKASLANILMEEVGEALQTTSQDDLRAELIQVAAVCAKWVEIIDLRKARG